MDKQQIDYAELSQERVITIGDLIEEIIRRIWIVIVAMVVFAAAVGGYKYVKDSRAAEAAADEQSLESVEDTLSEEEKKDVNNVINIQNNLEEQQEYVENSILMQINAYDESNVIMQYHFDVNASQNDDYSYDLLTEYQNYIDSGAIASDLKDKGIELDPQYISELISIDYNMISSDDTVINFDSAQANSFTIKVIHKSEEECLRLAETIAQCMNEYRNTLSDTIGAHSLTLVNQFYSEVVDRDLWTYKLDRTNSIVTMQSRIEELEEGMSDSQMAVINYYSGEETADSGEDTESQPQVGISKKYVAAGALAGIVLACLYIIVCYIMRGTINKAVDLQNLYNLRILGEVWHGRKRNIFIRIWDVIIGRKTRVLSAEEERELLLSNLQISCEKNHITKLFLSGSLGLKEEENWLDEITGSLRKAGIEAEWGGNFPYSLATFDKLVKYEHVVIVEKIRTSRYEDVGNEIKTCMEQNADILGAIVLH